MALVVIIGGARCGKSQIAEELARQRFLQGSKVSVAVFGNPDGDDVEFAERIKHHKENRPAEFVTIEAFHMQDWLSEVEPGRLLLVDCLGTALSAMMAHERPNAMIHDRIDAPLAGTTEKEFLALVENIVARADDTIVVTNAVGNGLVPEYESGRIFRDILGRANRMLVSRADSSYYCVCGRLIKLDELPMRAMWPTD